MLCGPRNAGFVKAPLQAVTRETEKRQSGQEEGGHMGMVWNGLGPSPPPQVDSLLRQTDGETDTWPVLMGVKREGSRFIQALVSKSWYCHFLAPLGKLLSMCEPWVSTCKGGLVGIKCLEQGPMCRRCSMKDSHHCHSYL